MATPQLDLSRPLGIYSEKHGDEAYRYIGQDNCLFDCRSHAFVRRMGDAGMEAPPATSAPPPAPSVPSNGTAAITCKACGKTYKLGPSPKTAAIAQDRMRKHLKKEHNVDLGEVPL